VGIHDDFIELGGDSLLALQVIARARSIGLNLTPRQVFDARTVAELATAVAAAVDTASAIEAEQGLLTGPVPLSPSQHSFFHQRFLNQDHYNLSSLLEVDARLDPTLVRQAVRHLLAHHDALRARFTRTDSRWEQRIELPGDPLPFVYADLSALPARKHEAAAEATTSALQKSLSLSQGPLLRVALIDLGANRTMLLSVIAHHVVCDAASVTILLEDLDTLYRQLAQGTEAGLPAKTASFRQWTERVIAYTRSPEMRREADYWLSLPWEQIAPLPLDHPEGRGNNVHTMTRSLQVSLTGEETALLQQNVTRTHDIQVEDAFVAAVAHAIARWTGGRWIKLDVMTSGRTSVPGTEDLNLSRTVGYMGISGALVLELPESDDPIGLLQSITEQARRIPNRGLGHGLFYWLGEDEITARLPCPIPIDVFVNYLGAAGARASSAPGPWSTRELALTRRGPLEKTPTLMQCQAAIQNGRFAVTWFYNANLHERATIKELADGLVEALRALIAHSRSSVLGRA
jgi:non-ribosomal peptide synthase protein (TIGR01720 family)